MPDIKGNNKQIFDYLSSQGAQGIGENADQFQKYMEKDENRRQIYDYLSSVNAQGIGNSYDEFTAFVYDGGQNGSAAKAAHVADNSKWAVPQASQWNARMDELQKSVMPGEPVSMPERKPDEPKGNPFPYRGGLEKEMRELGEAKAQATENVAGDLDLINEYDRRLKELHKSFDQNSKKAKENEKWLREHKAAYEAAKGSDAMREYARADEEFQEAENAVGKAENDIARAKNRDEMASPAEVVATGKTPFGNDNIGRGDSEYKYRKLADELYASADKEYGKSSKFDDGYKGDFWDQLWTASKQFVADAGNNIDSGSLTMGLSKGAAMEEARQVGEKYNGIITKTLKDMKMSDADVKAVLSSMAVNLPKIQAMDEELKAESAEIDTMSETFEDMVRRGDPDARSYGEELKKRIDAYNKRVNEEYKPLVSKYDNDREAYDKVMSAIDAAVENGLTGGEKALLDALEKFTEAKTLRSDDVSTAGKAGAGAEQSAEFMLDFILTGGISKGGAKVAAKLAKNRALKKFGAEALKGMTVKPGLGLRLATDAAVSGLRTAAVFPRTIQAYGENATEYSGKDYAGRINFDRTQANALGNSLLTQFIEYWSEGFGEYFGEAEQALFKSVTKQAPKEMIGKTLRNYRGSIGQYLDKGKFDGMFNEMLEEVVGSGFNALSGWLSNDRVGDADAMKEFFSGENIATLALSFLPMSAISSATNVKAYHKMKQRYDEGVRALNPFIESGAISRGELEKLSKDIPNLTPQEVKDRVVAIADRAREFNEGHLPKDFAKNLLGYLEGDFAMNFRNDEWEDSREKMSVVESYSSMYANPNLAAAWDIDQAETETRIAAEDAGFSQEELDLDSYQIAQDAKELRDTDPDRADILLAYANAKAASAGLENGYREQSEQIAQANAEYVRSNIDVNGKVVRATVTEYGVPKQAFILSDDVTVAPDGTVSTPTGNGLVRYVVSQNGEFGPAETIMADKVSEAVAEDTESFIANENAKIADEREAAYEFAKATVSSAGKSRAIARMEGRNVVFRGNGAYQPIRVERMTDDGAKVVVSGDKEALKGLALAARVPSPGSDMLEIDVNRLWPLLSKESDGSLTTFDEPKAKGQEQTREQTTPSVQVNPDELPDTDRTVMIDGKPTTVHVDSVGGDGVWYTYKDENGVEREGDMSLDAFTAALVNEQAQAPVAESPAQAQNPAPARTSSIPVDEKTGKRVFDHPSVTPEMAYGELMNGVAPGSKNEANRRKFIEASAAKAANALAEAQNKIAGLQARRDAVDEWEINDDEDIDAFEARQNEERAKFDAQIAEVEAQVPELQRKAAHWAAVRDMAGAVSSERKDAKLVEAADAWTKRTGVKVRAFRTPDEIDDKTVRDALAKGERVGGWYNPNTDEVGLYLPNLADEAEVAKTFIHEVISHKGLRDMLGKENYDALCDKVWDQLMSEEDRQKYLDYNSHLTGSEEFLRRAAADEWIAHFSETLGLEENKNLFDKFVEFVKEFLDRILGEDAKISKDDLATLLRSSLARYESERKSTADAKPLSMESLPADIQAELREKGEVMDGGVVMDDLQDRLKKETGYKTPNELDMESNPIVGDVRLSKTTMPAWAANYMTYSDAKEHVVKVLENLTERMSADELVNGVVPQGTYKYGEKSSGGFAGPLRTNIEYVVTFDMDTSCPRSLQYLEYIKMIEAQIRRPMTQREMIQLTEMMRAYGQMIPCVYCYCENKRQALKQYYTCLLSTSRCV